MGDITVIAVHGTQVGFQNCASFTKCLTKIDGTTKDDAEELVMSMFNLLEYSLNYSDTTGSLWFYYKDKATNFENGIANTKCFMYKAKLLGTQCVKRYLTITLEL